MKTKNNDEILDTFSKTTNTLMDLVDKDDNYAMLALCVRYQEETGKEDSFIETNIAANGYFGVLEEGLYSELLDQVQRGDMRLFASIRAAIRDVEAEIGLDPTDDIDVEGEDHARIIH